jgi:hypothetical protein
MGGLAEVAHRVENDLTKQQLRGLHVEWSALWLRVHCPVSLNPVPRAAPPPPQQNLDELIGARRHVLQRSTAYEHPFLAARESLPLADKWVVVAKATCLPSGYA